MDQLPHLADLIKERNRIDAEISAIIQRPAQTGHIGEYIASEVFDLTLHPSASTRGSDGYFNTGPLAPRSVNVKWYSKLDGLLDVNPEAVPDYYLVLTGPRAPAMSSRGLSRPLAISKVFLFDAPALVEALRGVNAKLSVATSVKKALWDAAEIYPDQHNALLPLTNTQRARLALFSPDRVANVASPQVIPDKLENGSVDEPNLYTAIAHLFVNDSFGEEVDAYIQAERQPMVRPPAR